MSAAARTRRAAGLRALLVLLAFALLALPGRALAGATPDTFFGAGTQWVVAGDAAHMGTYADAMQRLALGTARQDAFWHKIEPQAPVAGVHTYRWGYGTAATPNVGSPDWLVSTLAQRGVTWAPIIDTTPTWARSDAAIYHAPPPAHLPDLTAFAQALAARYGDPGSAFWTAWKAAHPGLPARPTTQYEIWNEENALGPFIPPATYPSIFDAAAAGIKAAQPAAQVQIGGLFYQPAGNQPSAMAYIDDMFAAAPAGWAPGAVGIHPYAAGLTGIVAHLRDFQSALAAAAAAHQPQLAGLPIMVNELGFPGEPSDIFSPADLNAGIEPDAARAAEVALLASAWWHSNCNVQNFLYFGISAPEGTPGYAENWQSLVRRGTGADTATSVAFAAVVAWARTAGAGAPYVHMCGSPTSGNALALDPVTVTPGGACGGGTTQTARVTFGANPVHGAVVRWAVVGKTGADIETNVDGKATFCAPAGELTVLGFVGSAFYKVPMWAKSPVWDSGAPPPPPPPPPPVNTVAPTISGTAQEDKTLTAAHGTWTGAPTAYTYQWLRCDTSGGGCDDIAGATAASYRLVADDVGHTVRVRVVAQRGAVTSLPATSDPTDDVVAKSAPPPPPPPANTAPPTITGAAKAGEKLGAVPGTWSGAPTSYTYRWLRCDAAGDACEPIEGANRAAYEVTADDVGHRLRVEVVAHRDAVASEPAPSGATDVVAPARADGGGGASGGDGTTPGGGGGPAAPVGGTGDPATGGAAVAAGRLLAGRAIAVDRRGRLVVRVRCSGAGPCAGSIVVRLPATRRTAKTGGGPLVTGRAKVKLGAGASVKVALRPVHISLRKLLAGRRTSRKVLVVVLAGRAAQPVATVVATVRVPKARR